MSSDPITRLAEMRIIAMHKELDSLIRQHRGSNIVVEIVRRLRDRAAESMTGLMTVSFTDTHAVATLQNEVKRYDEFMGWLREILQEGMTFDQNITREEREEMFEILMQTEDGVEEARALGLLVDDQP